jgi:citronellyl-CoA dehydrogenase
MQLTHEHEELRRTYRRVIEEEINPYVNEWEAAQIFPAHEVFKKLGRLGLLGVTKPVEYGGLGLDYSYGAIIDETSQYIKLRRNSDGDRCADRYGDAGAGTVRIV